MDNSIKKDEIKDNFNNEIIWNNKRDLFTKYFKKTIESNAHRLIIAPVDPNLDFDNNISRIKNF